MLLSITVLVCWYAALRVITSPSLLQVTVVAGPPVEVQVRVAVWPIKVMLVTLGAPGKQATQTILVIHLCTKSIQCCSEEQKENSHKSTIYLQHAFHLASFHSHEVEEYLG